MFLRYTFLITFSVALLIANIYCFVKKKYLYLFIPCMLFLPEYYGIEINNSLPLITITRLMFLVFYIYAILNRKQKITLKNFDIKNLPKQYYLLASYFVFRIITNLYYITTYSQAVKTIFSIIFEQLFLLIAVYMLAPSKKEINTTIKAIVWSATVLFIVGIFESFTYIRPFDALYTVSRKILNIHYVRLGLLRATTTMGMPGFFGNMCLLVTPLILYLHKITKHRRYILVMFLEILAIIHSGCRSDMIFFISICLIYIFLLRKDKEELVDFIKFISFSTMMIVIWISIFCINNSYARYYYTGNIKSVLNSFGFEFDLNESAPAGSGGYGDNINGTGSRLTQLNAMIYVAKKNAIWGMGSGAQNRNEIDYSWYGKQAKLKSYDTGILEIFCDEGIIGIIGILCLMIYLFIKSRNCLFYQLSFFTFLLSTLATTHMFAFCFMFIILMDSNTKDNNILYQQQ